jgi:ATPase subunit of ABC transporter with duplicated ATPase domains
LQEFVSRFRSVTSKASQAMSKLKQIERMELIEQPQAPRKPFRFQIPPPPRGGSGRSSLGRHSHGLRHASGLSRPRPHDRTRGTHGAGRAEWRGQIHAC